MGGRVSHGPPPETQLRQDEVAEPRQRPVPPLLRRQACPVSSSRETPAYWPRPQPVPQEAAACGAPLAKSRRAVHVHCLSFNAGHPGHPWPPLTSETFPVKVPPHHRGAWSRLRPKGMRFVSSSSDWVCGPFARPYPPPLV